MIIYPLIRPPNNCSQICLEFKNGLAIKMAQGQSKMPLKQRTKKGKTKYLRQYFKIL